MATGEIRRYPACIRSCPQATTPNSPLRRNPQRDAHTRPALIVEASAQHPTACENCGSPLYGDYCHACGQSAHNPVKHLGHAIEDVFESFWHLDGRVTRTLRDLLVPGRVARNYLDGHRARYRPPLRLFVILTLFTFFVAKATVQLAPAEYRPINSSALANVSTVEEVEAIRHEQLAGIDQAIEQTDQQLALEILESSRLMIHRAADDRIRQIDPEGRHAGSDTVSVPIDDPAQADQTAQQRPFTITVQPWSPESEPVRPPGP